MTATVHAKCQITATAALQPRRTHESSSRPDDDRDSSPRRLRAVFISNTRLGSPGCRAAPLLDFLRSVESDYVYLVGDIVDGRQIERRWYWHQTHNDVVQKLLRKVRKGTSVIYVPGNHDRAARQYVGNDFGGIVIRHEATHVTADGRRLLVLHGGPFDRAATRSRGFTLIGDTLRTFLRRAHGRFDAEPTLRAVPQGSPSRFGVPADRNDGGPLSPFEVAAAHDAHSRGFDGVVRGGRRAACVRTIGSVVYGNAGDWVESLSALVEAQDGTLSALQWHENQPASSAPARTAHRAASPGIPSR